MAIVRAKRRAREAMEVGRDSKEKNKINEKGEEKSPPFFVAHWLLKVFYKLEGTLINYPMRIISEWY